MTRTPDEIKKGLECCLFGQCGSCPYSEEYGCDCSEHLRDDIREYHDQLEAERDAALADFKLYRERNIKGECGVYACDLCKHGGRYEDWDENKCPTGCTGVSHWEWRGVQKEE